VNRYKPHRRSKPNLSHCAHHNEAGGATPWLITGLLLLAAIVAVALWGPGRGDESVDTPTDPPPAHADPQALDAELTELGDLFGLVMDNKRDAQPLIDRIDRLIADYPDLAAAHMLRGQVLMYTGRLDPALASMDRSLEIEPRQADVHLLAGTMAMQMDRVEVARYHYEQALAIEPDNGRHAVFLANVQHKLGQDDEAVATLLAALRRDSQLHSAYALMSDIYTKQNKLGMALDQIERAIEATPVDNPRTHVAYSLKRAALFRRDNQPAESLAVLGALPPDARLRPDVLRDTATSWALLGKPALAAEHYENVLTVDPSNDHAAAEAARWWIKAGDTEAAGRNLQTLRRINPRHPAIPELDAVIIGN
jgi:tetratricopeptide (TPR) repeat protein